MQAKIAKTEVIANDNPDEIIEDFLDWLLCRYQIRLETQLRGSDFIFDCIKTNFKVEDLSEFNGFI